MDHEDALLTPTLIGNTRFQTLCRRLRANDPTLYRVSLTTCYVDDGVYDDRLCAALVHCLKSNGAVRELVLALPDQIMQPGARALTSWISQQPLLRKVSLFRHGVAGTSSGAASHITDHARSFLAASASVEAVDIRLAHTEVAPLQGAIHDLLCRSKSIAHLHLTVVDDSAVVNVSVANEWTMLRDAMRLNTTLQSVTLVSPPPDLLEAAMNGLQHHPSLKSLVLESIRSDGKGVQEAPPKCHEWIRRLLQASRSLTHVRLRTATFPAVASLFEGLGHSTSLVRLEVAEVDCSGLGVRLCQAIRLNASLQELSLSGTALTQDGLGLLVECLTTSRDARLHRLSLAGNDLDQVGSARLVRSLLQEVGRCRLESLDLSGNEWGAMDGIGQLAEGIRDLSSSAPVLKELSLASCGLGDEGASVVAASLEANASVGSLDLEDNGISVGGVRALVRLLQMNACLQVLDLSFNSIGDEGASLLAACMKDASFRLIELNVVDCGIEDDGLAALGSALEKKHSSVQKMRVADNIFTDAGYDSFVTSLPKMEMLKKLSIDLSIEAEGLWSAFADAVYQNQCLISISPFDADCQLWMSPFEPDDQNPVIQDARDVVHFALLRNRLHPLLTLPSVPDSLWPDVLSWRQGLQTLQRSHHVNARVTKSVAFHIVRARLPLFVEKLIAHGKRKRSHNEEI